MSSLVSTHDPTELVAICLGQVSGSKASPLEFNLPESLTIEQWADIGRKLCRLEQVCNWWLGDWAAYGVKKYGKLKDFADVNGIDYGTLRNLAWVSSSVSLSRRRDNVQWSKHAEVASLPAKEQDRWLSIIEKEELPRAEIRRRIRKEGGDETTLQSDGPNLRLASRSCDDLTNWLRSRPEEFWDEERRAIWRDRLRPIVEFAQNL